MYIVTIYSFLKTIITNMKSVAENLKPKANYFEFIILFSRLYKQMHTLIQAPILIGLD